MLKEYYYISDQKVNSYEAQIPANRTKLLGAEVSASIGVLSTKLRTREPAETRISRLKLVIDFIERHYDIGTTVIPQKWVKDKLLVRHVQLKNNPEVFLLMGKNEKNELCTLYGSARHILGAKDVEIVGASPSHFEDFANIISRDMAQLDLSDVGLDMIEMLSDGQLFQGGIRDSEVCSILCEIYRNSKGRLFEIEFLGRRVFQSETAWNIDPIICKAFAPVYVSIET